MKVLVLTNMYPSDRKPSSGIFVKEQVEDLRALGLDMRVLAFDGTESRLNYFRAVAQLRHALKAEPCDLVHAHYGLTGAIAMTQRIVPIVTTFHGSDFNGFVPWQARVSWLVARRTTPIFVSSEAKRRLDVLSAPIIPAAVDTDRFVPHDRARAREQLGWDPAAHYVLFPGSRTTARKNPALFDAAVAVARESLPGLRAVSLEDLAREEVALVMNAVDVMLMTSHAEGSPVAVKEALACATPVVSVPVGDVPEILAGLPSCEIVSRHPRPLAEAALAALGVERDSRLRSRALCFSRPRMALRIATVYNEILAANLDRRSR
jgi:glycosyltransferase involved in cell wall biosynthesis